MKNLLQVSFLVILLWSCTSSVHFMKYTNGTYRPTNSIEVFRKKPTEKKYEELGELSLRIKNSNRENAVMLLIKKAKKIGADAIIILGEESEGRVIVPVGSF